MRRAGRIVSWVVGSLVALLLLLVPLINLLLGSPFKDRLLERYVPEPFEVRIERARLALWRTFPDARLTISGAEVSYADRVLDTTVDVDTLICRVDWTRLLRDELDVQVDTLIAHMGEGAHLRASARVEDLLGDNPLYQAEAQLGADLAPVLKVFRGYLSGVSAAGRIEASLHADVHQSALCEDSLYAADLNAQIYANRLSIEDPADSINALLLRPHIDISPKPNVINTQPDALGLYIELDSLYMAVGEQIRASARGFRAMGQSTVEPIDSLKLPPVAGWVVADQIYFRGSDALYADVGQTDIDFSIRRQDIGTLPYLKFGGGFGDLQLGNDMAHAGLSGLSLGATASMRGAREQGGRRRRYAGEATPDSLRRESLGQDSLRRDFAIRDSVMVDSLRKSRLPEFLSDESFRAADFDIRLDKSMADLINKWEPTGRIRVRRGYLDTPALPLDTRLRGLSGRFAKDTLTLDSLSVSVGRSDARASGTLRGLLRALSYGGWMSADVALRSDYLDVTEFMTALKTGAADRSLDQATSSSDNGAGAAAGDSSLLLIVPANVVASLSVDARNVLVDTLLFQEVSSSVDMQKRAIRVSRTHAAADFGSVDVDGFYSTQTRQNISAGFDVRLNDITADRVLTLLPSFDTLMPLLKSFKGRLNVEVAATSQLDTNMHLLLPTLDGMFRIKGNDLVVEDIGKLKKVTRWLFFKHKGRFEISDLDAYGVISDNELEVFPFLLGIDRYTMAISGRQSFDSGYKYKVSLLESILPFRVGLTLSAADYNSRLKVRLCTPPYKSKKLPDYTSQLDEMRSDLRYTIDNIFTRGAQRALDDTRSHRVQLTGRLESDGYGRGIEEGSVLEAQDSLSASQLARMERLLGDALGDSPDESFDNSLDDDADSLSASQVDRLELILRAQRDSLSTVQLDSLMNSLREPSSVSACGRAM